MDNSTLLYTGAIQSVKFSVTGTDAVREDTSVTITSHEMFRGGEPYPFGVYDARLGTTSNYRCLTCMNSKKTCLGHEGSIELNYPVINPIALEEIPKWLKVICHSCGVSVIPESKYIKFPKKVRLDKIPSETRGKVKHCPQCKALHPTVRRDEINSMLFIAETSSDRDGRKVLYPHHIARIFDRITNETVIKFGKPVESHPKNFILFAIKVPSVSIRPDARQVTGGQSNNDDVTTLLQDIVKKNSIMPTYIPEEISDKYGVSAIALSEQYFKLVRDSGEKSVNSIANRLKGKKGRFRKNQMGKRVRNMCRSTITGDPTIAIDEVGIPLIFAQRIQFEETVQEYNKSFLMSLVRNGRNYPGATKIRKKLTGVEYDIDPSRDIEIEIGDTILRDVLDGDPVGFNRQPSLGSSNIGTHRVKVTRDPKIKTIRMNVMACPLKSS